MTVTVDLLAGRYERPPAALRSIAEMYPGATVVRNDVGNLAVLTARRHVRGVDRCAHRGGGDDLRRRCIQDKEPLGATQRCCWPVTDAMCSKSAS